MGSDDSNWHSELDYDRWVALPIVGPRPSARYKHSAVIVDEKLYIVGESRNGRQLSDVQSSFSNSGSRKTLPFWPGGKSAIQL
ncbi:hypothetical protein M8C21_032180 [Ambrosia artemisiifolia]|uniref:Uncharacterized protein n=1 Tax=Ambrosia artemisiifolia TaxID=4212 RepID=A0AAD5GGU9_AMBAR|nr:hypothetical protein M8C21_032180 [Ambrosia artemisiifolia]